MPSLDTLPASSKFIEQSLPAIRALCRAHRVLRLDLFGSAATGRFDPTRSDLDFLVEFDPQCRGGFSNPYFALLEALEALFERKIDLIDAQTLENPYRRRRIESERIPLYQTSE